MSNNFKVFYGIAVEDRASKSRKLKVYLRELTPFSGGDIADKTRNEKYSTTDDDGNTVSGTVSTTNCVVADYFGSDTNRAFPPDIVAGEQVIVLQYADEDNYYWMPGGRDDNLRKGELDRWAISDDMAESKSLTESNTYFVELDTKITKRIRIHTSKSDGEAFGYDIVIDAANSNLQITDDAGNLFNINSPVSVVHMRNAFGSIVRLDKEVIQIMARRMVYIKAPIIVLDGTVVDGAPIGRAGSVYSMDVSRFGI